MRYGKICPILSINSYLDCKKEECRLWLDGYDDCALKHNPDNSAVLNRIADSLERISVGTTYSSQSKIPSASEGIVMTVDALHRIAEALEIEVEE